MNSKPGTPNRYRRLVLAIGFMAIAALGRASVIMNVQSVTAAAGSTGNTLDVTLTNTGPNPVTIAGFSFGLDVGTSNLSFTGVTTGTTATYIFDGQSLFGPDISVGPLPGQTLQAEDIYAVASSGATIGSGAVVGLGHVQFNLSAATPSGGIAVSFVPAADSLTDQNGNLIAFSAENGTVTVTGGTVPVPEPAASAFVCTALMGFVVVFRLFGRCTT